jgi:hypothetical protein
MEEDIKEKEIITPHENKKITPFPTAALIMKV